MDDEDAMSFDVIENYQRTHKADSLQDPKLI